MAALLGCNQLKAGDLLLKVSNGSVVNEAIRFGQWLTGGRNSEITHAGVMFDSTCIIEAIGKGVSAGDLRVQHKDYAYYVYRCKNPNMAAGAGTCAKMMFDIHQRQGTIKYTMSGAAGSLIGSGQPTSPAEMGALLDRVLSGRNQSFFCSMFVVYAYQFVAEQCGIAASTMFNESAAKVAPTKLASMLVSHPQFTEIGWLLPGKR